MINHPNRSKDVTLGPGQWVEPPKRRAAPTPEKTVWEAVSTGKHIRQAIEAIEAMIGAPSFRLSELEVMLHSLEAQISERRDLHSALMRKLNDAPKP